MQKIVYLSLGTNVGVREDNLTRALAELILTGIEVTALSSVYETEPRHILRQPWFLNMAVQAKTDLMPRQLITRLLRIEREMGRIRKPGSRNGPRLIDIDILLFGNTVMNTEAVTIPHPRLTERRFVLEPLLEIAPDLRHPVTRRPLREALAETKAQKVRVKR